MNAAPVVAGVVVGLGVAAGLRALALAGGAPRVADAWLNGLGVAVAAGTLVLSWLARSPAARRLRPSVATLGVTGGMLASLAVATYWGLGNDIVRYHTWEHFHYYLGAKYFRELSYTRLYSCTAVAEAERVGRGAMDGRRMRDLEADRVVPVDAALDDPGACTRHFTPERWRQFGDDVMWFRGALGRMWDRMQQDHGFNPPPTWTLAGGALARIGPAGARTQTVLALLDPLLLAVMLGLVAWAFGPHVSLVAVVVWGCQVPGQGTWTTGAFLRQDWLVLVVAAACLLRRGFPAAGGAALASATALRLFPVFLLGIPAVVMVRRALQSGRIARFDRRFAFGVTGGAAAWFLVSTAVFGLDAWAAFWDHIAVHRLSPLANHVGLRSLLAQSWNGRWTAVMQPAAIDPFQAWETSRRETFAARRSLYDALALSIAAFAAVAGWRVRRLWAALAASSVLVLTAVDIASYYCAFLIVLGLLAAASRVEGWLALAAIVASRGVNALPIATGNPDLRYTVQSVVFLVWAALALGLLAWRPRVRRVPAPVATRGRGVERRRHAPSPGV